MKKLHAPLCGRCARMLHSFPIAVYKIDSIADNDSQQCGWCQRNKTDALYRIQFTR